jgi:hypothetical protein
MTQGTARPVTGQLVTYRHQALAAPTLLDEGTLAPPHVAAFKSFIQHKDVWHRCCRGLLRCYQTHHFPPFLKSFDHDAAILTRS